MAAVPRRRLVPRTCAALVAVPVVLLVPVGAAAAAPLVPGGQWTTAVDLPDAWAARADRLGVSVAELRQRENGCTRPEVRAGDLTCGEDEGDLAGQVLAAVSAGRWAADDCVSSTAAQPLDLAGGTTRLTVVGAECLLVTLDFPDGADDDLAQSDSLGLTLSLVAAGPGGDGTAGGTTPRGTTGGGTTTDGPGAVEVPRAGTGSADGSVGVAGQGAAGAGGASGREGSASVGAASVGSGGRPSSIGGAVRGGAADDPAPIGSTTTDIEVGAEPTEAGATRSLLGDPLALGALLLGTTALLWLLFLALRRRRGAEA